MAQTYIVDKDGNQIDAATATVPADRHFRDAWSLSGKVISEDMTAAKTIFKDKIREVRGPLLAAEDVVYMKALEADDASAKSASVTKKAASCVMHPPLLQLVAQTQLLNSRQLGIHLCWAIALTHKDKVDGSDKTKTSRARICKR